MKCFGTHIICLSYSFYFSLFIVLGKYTRATISMPTIKLVPSANFSLFKKVEKKELSSRGVSRIFQRGGHTVSK